MRTPPRGPAVSRRAALAGAGGLALSAAACGREIPAPSPPSGPFRHGVASGDPDQTSVVLWTAISDDGGGPRGVELAEDEGFTRVVFRWQEDRRYVQPSPLTFHKPVAEGLAPGRTYFYRFWFGGVVSPVGRTATLPEGEIARWRIAAVSCSNYPAGYFNVYRDIAARDDVDLILHLGDYIYEYGMGEYATEDAEALGRVPDPPHEIITYEDYSRRYAQYRSDPDLQAAHAAAPWVMIWDDHETANDSWKGGAQNHQPDEGPWRDRRDAALRAFFDWAPMREPSSDPRHAWRAYEIGNLLTLTCLESRLSARAEPIELDEFPALPDDMAANAPEARAAVAAYMARLNDPAREMLGAAQMAFVAETLAASRARGTVWQVIGNQVLMGRNTAPDYASELPGWLRAYARWRSPGLHRYIRRSRFGLPANPDAWDGYGAARERFYDAAKAAGANLVVLTGDTHNFWAIELEDAAGNRAGAEFGTSAVSSPSPFLALPTLGVDVQAMTRRANPHILRHNYRDRGYIHLTLTPQAATADFIAVDTVAKRNYRARLDSRWRVRPSDGGVSEIEPA
ncbi:MAG: alkaline phosphatase D family protein [Maricaulaceae bacterium]|nr:alkaline phosphatase D family protein [Maricaulaceae bacterium]